MINKVKQYIENNEKLKGGLIGISIRSISSGEVLVEHNSDIRLHPASNMKLLTAAAAFNVLGADYRFETEIKRQI